MKTSNVLVVLAITTLSAVYLLSSLYSIDQSKVTNSNLLITKQQIINSNSDLSIPISQTINNLNYNQIHTQHNSYNPHHNTQKQNQQILSLTTHTQLILSTHQSLSILTQFNILYPNTPSTNIIPSIISNINYPLNSKNTQLKTDQAKYRKMKIHWLINNGNLISFIGSDQISMRMATMCLDQQIFCGQSDRYQFKAGDMKKFSQFWIPVDSIVAFSLVQHNLILRDDAVSITTGVKQQAGYYEVNLSIQQWKAGYTISFNFIPHVQIDITKPAQRIKSDYYLLTEVTDQYITVNQSSLPAGCSNKWEKYTQISMLALLITIVMLFMH